MIASIYKLILCIYLPFSIRRKSFIHENKKKIITFNKIKVKIVEIISLVILLIIIILLPYRIWG